MDIPLMWQFTTPFLCLIAVYFVSVLFKKNNGQYDYDNPTVLHGQTGQTPKQQAKRVQQKTGGEVTHHSPTEYSVENDKFYLNTKVYDTDPTRKKKK